MLTPTATQSTSDTGWFARWWRTLAYHHQWAEGTLYLMFATGLLLWSRIDLYWPVQRWVLATHMLVGATFFVLVVGAFWLSHRRLITSSKKPFLVKTGSIIEWLLMVCSLSGFYLFFFGAPGNAVGNLISEIHFYSSWLLVPLVFRHAIRWSIVNIMKSKTKA